jgi:hypothetical protein
MRFVLTLAFFFFLVFFSLFFLHGVSVLLRKPAKAAKEVPFSFSLGIQLVAHRVHNRAAGTQAISGRRAVQLSKMSVVRRPGWCPCSWALGPHYSDEVERLLEYRSIVENRPQDRLTALVICPVITSS